MVRPSIVQQVCFEDTFEMAPIAARRLCLRAVDSLTALLTLLVPIVTFRLSMTAACL